jgi:4-amino-4-deoxy-L-arabinose transferase-like glycosyltransferase
LADCLSLGRMDTARTLGKNRHVRELPAFRFRAREGNVESRPPKTLSATPSATLSPTLSARGSARIAATVLLGVLSLFVAWASVAAIPWEEADENALVATAARIASNGDAAIPNDHPLRYSSLQLVENQTGTLYSKYPIGYPLLVAAAWKVGGIDAALLLNPFLYIAAVGAMFLLGLRLGGTGAAICAALLFATHPTVAFLSGLAFNYMAAWTCSLWALVVAWRWKDRGGVALAIAAGLLTGFAVSIRAPQILLAFPLTALACARLKETGLSPAFARQSTAGLAAVLVGLAPTAIHQAVAFGSPWITGYSLTGETSGGLRSDMIAEHAGLFASQALATGVLPTMIIGTVAVLASLRRRNLEALVLSLWALPSFCLGLAWYHRTGSPHMDLRLFVPVFAPLALAAASALASFGRAPRQMAIVTIATILLVATPSFYSAQLIAFRRDGLTRSRTLYDQVGEQVPDGSVLFVSDSIGALLDASARWKVYDLAHGSDAARALRDSLEKDGPSPGQRMRFERLAQLWSDPTAMTSSAVKLALAAHTEGISVFSIEGKAGATLRYALGVGLTPQFRAELPVLGKRGALYEFVDRE